MQVDDVRAGRNRIGRGCDALDTIATHDHRRIRDDVPATIDQFREADDGDGLGASRDRDECEEYENPCAHARQYVIARLSF
jgi:hypothetical protein